LRPEEALPVLRHRDTASAPTNTSHTWQEASVPAPESRKKHKKDKKKKEKEKERKGPEATTDLLEMNFESPSAALSVVPESAARSSKSKSKALWFPFSSYPGSYEASYAVESLTFNGRDIGTLSLLFRVDSLSDSSLSLELTISSHSSGSYRLSAPHGKVSLVGEGQQVVRVDLAPTINPLLTNTIECLLTLATESSALISTENNQTFAVKIPLSLPFFFQAHTITINELQALCANNTSSSPPFTGQVSLTLPRSSSSSSHQKQLSKTSKILLGYLNAHPVEQIDDMSIAGCSSLRLHGSGSASYLICSFIKFLPGAEDTASNKKSKGRGGDGVARIEIKVFGADGRIAQQIGNQTLSALSSLSLN
jgi:hypothetical protein